MMICPKCGVPNQEEARFCAVCGAEMAVVPASTVPGASPITEETPSTVEAETVSLSEGQPSPYAEQAVEPSSPFTEQPPAQPYQPPFQPPYPPAQPPYGQPPYWQLSQPQPEEPISFGKFLGMMALEAVCWIAHIVLMFVWGFSSKSSQTLKNYARAKLVMAAITTVLSLIFVILWFSLVFGMVDSIGGAPYYY